MEARSSVAHPVDRLALLRQQPPLHHQLTTVARAGVPPARGRGRARLTPSGRRSACSPDPGWPRAPPGRPPSCTTRSSGQQGRGSPLAASHFSYSILRCSAAPSTSTTGSPPLQRPRKPPRALVQEHHHGGHESHPYDERVHEHTNGQPERDLLDGGRAGRDEGDEDADHDQGGRRDDSRRRLETPEHRPVRVAGMHELLAHRRDEEHLVVHRQTEQHAHHRRSAGS